MMDWHSDKSQWGGHFGGRYMRRGNMRPIVLAALQEKPMHGYELMTYLEKMTHGWWRPSPGSIYPTLQMLEDEGLVEAKGVDGKRVYELTAAGRKEAAQSEKNEGEDWSKYRELHKKPEFKNLVENFMGVAKLVKQIAKSKDESKAKAASRILDQAKDQLSDIIIDETTANPPS